MERVSLPLPKSLSLAPCFGSQNDSALSALNDGACFVFSISLSSLILFV
jgi:hypothetical protein